MHITFVIALGGDLVRSTEHVGIGLLTAFLRKNGYSVDNFEVLTDDLSSIIPELLVTLKEKKTSVLGFSTSCVNIALVLRIAEKVKAALPHLHIVLGGHMATFWGAKILKQYPEIDSIVYGEGEYTLLELVQTLERQGSLSSVESLIFRDDSAIRTNPMRPLIADINTLPFPDRDQFELHNGQLQYLRISTSRGCFGRCAFCSNFVGRKQSGSRWRGREPENVVEEIRLLVDRYNFHTFDFVDSAFEDPGSEGKERIKKIAQLILDHGLEIYYNCCFRAEDWQDSVYERELLTLLIASGLEKVNIGFESGNERGLRILNKNASIENNWSVIRLLADFPDIYITFGFIMLHPYSSKPDLLDNAKFLYDTGIGQVIRHYFWQLEVYPGTLMEENLFKDNLLKEDYNIADGMYRYKFLYPEVERFSRLFSEMLKVKSVWDFEIFDIIIHTFITRLRRKYQNDVLLGEINGFARYVTAVRTEMARYNYHFFLRLYNEQFVSLKALKKELDEYILTCMNNIQKEQLRFGLKVKRDGYALVNR